MNVRAFVPLGKHLPKEFLEVVLELHYLVSDHGIENTPVEPQTREEWLAYFAMIHDGWKEAQRRIAVLLKERLVRRSEAQADEAEQRRLRSKEGQTAAKRRLQAIGVEMLVLRRTLDVILWTIFAGEHSTLRRLFVQGGQHNLSAKNIDDAIPAAEFFNRDPQVMAVCTDMLSIVHVGDLLIANRGTGELVFSELKTGEKNLAITAAAEFAIRSGCERFEKLATASYDKADQKHYERVKRQSQRNETILNTIRDEGGTDPSTGAQVFIHPTEEPSEFWTDTITACYQQLNDAKQWAIGVIDECLYLGVYSSQEMAFIGFQAWMDREKCESPIHNLTDSFFDPGTRPLGATLLPRDLREKILRGDILVVMCLDIAKMIALANRIQPGYMSLATKKESSRMRQERAMGDFTLRGLLIKTNEGGGVSMFLGGGFRDRILFDQHRPAQLIAQNMRSSVAFHDKVIARHAATSGTGAPPRESSGTSQDGGG
jgi:hypothetical protein